MRNIISILLSVVFSSYSFCQIDLEKRLTKNVVDCWDIAINSANAFGEYMNNGDFDSAKLVLDFWEVNCGNSEPLQRSRIIYSIYTSSMNESVYDSSIFAYVHNYIFRLESASKSNFGDIYYSHSDYFGYIPLNSDFDLITKRLAQDYTQYDNELERLYCLLYSGQVNSFYHLLRQPEFSPYLVRKLYEEEMEEYRSLPKLHIQLSGGLIIPTGNASLIGNRPQIGMNVGLEDNRWIIDFTTSARFGPTKDKYQVYRLDTTSTNYYFGYYFGMEGSYDLIHSKNYRLSVVVGAGIDCFDSDAESSLYNYSDYRALSFNGNFGLTNRFRIDDKHYLGIIYKYNIVNYNSERILTDFSGNIHSLTVAFGWFLNEDKIAGVKDCEKTPEFH